MRNDINRVRTIQNFIVILRNQRQSLTDIGQAIRIFVGDSGQFHAVDILAFPDEFVENRRISQQSDTQSAFFRADLGAGNALCAFQINHLAVFLQIIKGTDPVGTDRKDIHAQTADIIDLLSFVFLDDDFIRESGAADAFNTLRQGLFDVDFTAGTVKVLGRYADDQVVSQRFCAFQKPYMPLV